MISLLSNDNVSRRFTVLPGELWKPPPKIDTFREPLGIVYVMLPTFENVITALEIGNRIWSYVPVASLALPMTFDVDKTDTISTVF